MQAGNINIQTENIFPIIKKFLYSDHEIFLRELVSNAVDATQKLKTLSASGEFKGEIGDTTIEVKIDQKKKTLHVIDRGIGMSGAEVEKYINEIAFSGAEEFVEKYKDSENAIIGHFGLGFYSAFMVSEKVEIITKSYRDEEDAMHWECDGSPEYQMDKHDKKERGTEIILHINEESKEFLEEGRISGILNKYCKFLPVEIKFGQKSEWIDNKEGKKDKEGNIEKEEIKVDNIINNTKPAWTKKPADLKDEDYKGFYRELYPMNFEDALFHIHLNVDYPFNLTGILYFPKIKNNFEIQKNKIQLYSNQVFITDNVENIVPEFLTLLQGVIDSPDIPLNVSRSYLQEDHNVKKISGYITKKVADKLAEMFKTNREDFEKKWDDIKLFMEYGYLTEDKFADKMEKVALFKNTEADYFTWEEYEKKIKPLQTDKDKKLVALYAADATEQHAFIETAKERGYDVLIMDSPLTSHYIQKLEQKHSDVSFARVDSDTLENLINKEEEIPSKLSKEQEEMLKPLVEEVVDSATYAVQFASLNESDHPMIITQSEFMRRMKEQQAVGGGGMAMFGQMPDSYNLVVNGNNPLIYSIAETKTEKKRKKLVKQAVDLALLSQGMLKGADLTSFIKRSIDLIK
jgi:molecular chaperone HtpG